MFGGNKKLLTEIQGYKSDLRILAQRMVIMSKQLDDLKAASVDQGTAIVAHTTAIKNAIATIGTLEDPAQLPPITDAIAASTEAVKAATNALNAAMAGVGTPPAGA